MANIRNRIASLLAALFCMVTVNGVLAQEKLEQRLVGKWRYSAQKTIQYLKVHSLLDEELLKSLENDQDDMTIEFGADGSVFLARPNKHEEMKAQWKLVREEETRTIIELIRAEEPTETTVEFLEDETISITSKNEQPTVFERVKAGIVQGTAAKLLGTWGCNKDATLKLDSNAAFTQDQIDEMLDHAVNMVITFNDDASFVAKTQVGVEIKQIDGTWSSENIDETKQAFHLKLDANDVPKSVQVEFRDDGTVCFTPDDQPGAVFVRKSENADHDLNRLPEKR